MTCDGCVDLQVRMQLLKDKCLNCRTVLKWAMNLRRTNPVAAWEEIERLAIKLEGEHG